MPCGVAVVVPREEDPSNTWTVEDASAVPENVGVVSVVLEPDAGDVMDGASGAVVSGGVIIVIVTAAEASDVLPAASVAVAVML